MDRPPVPGPDLPELRRALVTERSAEPTRENSGNEVALAGQVRAARGIDAGMDRVQATIFHAVVDGFVAVPDVEELLPGDRPVLPSRKRPGRSRHLLCNLPCHSTAKC